VGGIWSVTFFSPRDRGPGHLEGYPGPGCPLYALASLRALAAEIERVLLDLFAVVVDDELGDRYPSRVAGVGALVVVVVILILSGWVRGTCAKLIHVNLLRRLAGLRGVPTTCGAIYFPTTSLYDTRKTFASVFGGISTPHV